MPIKSCLSLTDSCDKIPLEPIGRWRGDFLRGCLNVIAVTSDPAHVERGSQGHLDLTELIGVPLPPSVSFVTGYEGFPAYSFGPNANVGRLTRTFAPDPFFRDFAVIVTARPTAAGGVLFAITDAFQRVVYLGLALSPVEDGTQRIRLLYTEPEGQEEEASFKVPSLADRWSRFTLTVQDDEVRLYMDCEEFHSVSVRRSSRPLSFEPGSGVFVGNAGATGLGKYEGSIQQLVIKPDPRAAEEQCEEDDPYASGDASGDDIPDDRETLDEVKKRVMDIVSSRLEDALSVPPHRKRGPIRDGSWCGGEELNVCSRVRGRKESGELRAPQAPLAPQGTEAPAQAGPGPSALRGPRGHPGPQEPQGGTATLVKREELGTVDREECQDSQDWRENPESKEKRVTGVWGSPDLLGPLDSQAPPAQPGSRVPLDLLAPQGSRAPRGPEDPRSCPPQAPRDPPVPRGETGRKASLADPASRALMVGGGMMD
ncbi:hypothetical protein COCON_G00137000 [Conger conger]|uniref:Thrombospondin-like N-terminal domain-containing protein n=1 Tax=Conger conger TaxID=82655 RepID=A0A9Q1DEX6_CONCO|nr:hypothetical protein COCON_G00137000 [Conger conger]